MKKLLFFGVVTILFFGCGMQSKNQQKTEEKPVEAVVLTVDELYQNAAEMADKEVVVKGTVMHVCKEGGARCFLMGSNEEINIRVEAGEKIGAFSQEQMGSEVEIAGILKVVKTEADAHNPGKEHGEGETENINDTVAENAHKIIAESQEAAEVVYFIEGLTVKENIKEIN
ncbi:MAG: hypothetical protein IPF54_19485 [Draconibacterium sp.]|nr:hypothetical protein [Draconibacterium sp.]